MLPLDSPRWSQLEHAYGPAGDVPDLLGALAAAEDRILRAEHRTDLWFRIWSSLCHQGTIYTASYAAVPHVVEIGARRPLAEQPMFWSFVGAVGSCVDAAPIPVDLRQVYDDALRRAEAHARECLVPGVSVVDAKTLLTALAGLGGKNALAAVFSSLDDELTLECAGCGEQQYLMLTDPPFVVRSEAFPDADIHAAAALARDAGLDKLAAQIDALDGATTCPSCGQRVGLSDSVAYGWP